jgi:hypothetical protein
MRHLANPGMAVLLCSLIAAGIGVPSSPQFAQAAKPKAPPKAETAGSSAPADLNDLSLRVTALTTLHDFDLLPDQLQALRTLTAGAADAHPRAPAKATPKLATALRELHDELLKPDGERLGELSARVDDLLDDKGVDLDDAVRTTDAARAKAPDFARRLKASQVAAYLANHAADVADPVEQMTGALAEAREDPDNFDDADAQALADDVARLVAGRDAAKVKQVSAQVLAWLKSARAIKDDEFAAKQSALEESARRIIGDVPPMDVLKNWLEGEVAELLSNPQLATAIDESLAAGATSTNGK